MTSSPFAAPTVGAKTVRTSDEMTSANVAGARRATLLSKVSLLVVPKSWSTDSAEQCAKDGGDDTTTMRFTLGSDRLTFGPVVRAEPSEDDGGAPRRLPG